jgi:hypothetical protein
MTKAYLIDPVTRTVEEVTYADNFTHIYSLIDCDTFTCLTFNEHNDTVFVDDEGLFKPDQHFFKLKGYPDPLAGKGLVLGTDEEGESVSPTISLEEFRKLISFPVMVVL